MSYKKAPSIKHLEKLRKAKYLREVRDNGIERMMNAMTPHQREQFNKALAEQVNAHKESQNK